MKCKIRLGLHKSPLELIGVVITATHARNFALARLATEYLYADHGIRIAIGCGLQSQARTHHLSERLAVTAEDI